MYPTPSESICIQVSYADSIFATQEVIAKYLKGGSRVYMCLYDLQKAFDSMEYPVLLKRLYDLGVNRKCWRIIKSWYKNSSCKVKLDEGVFSESYPVERGVKAQCSPLLYLWDSAHHLGTKHLKGLQNLTRLLAHHGQGSKPCPLCDAPTHPLIEHVP